jgi:hypothetical protein
MKSNSSVVRPSILKVYPNECLDVVLTDIQLHASKVRNPSSIGRQYVKAIHGSRSHRAYSNDIKTDGKDKISLSANLGMEQLYDLARKRGKKYVRIFAGKDGLPVYLGQDSVEKLESLMKKILRKSSKSV